MRSLIFAVLIAFSTVPAMSEDTEKTAMVEKAQKAQKAEKQFKPPPGYKTRHRGDNTVYCRKTTELGSRFAVERCFSEEQLVLELERIEIAKEAFERSRRICSDPSICAPQ
jgi:hypothetical protein